MGDWHGTVQSSCGKSTEMAGEKSAGVRTDGSTRRVAKALEVRLIVRENKGRIVMTLRYTEYVRLKTGRYQSVGKFGDEIYAYEVLTGVTDSPEYHQISKAEFDSFETWTKEYISDLKKLYDIINRPVICSGYLGKEELDTSLLRDLENE